MRTRLISIYLLILLVTVFYSSLRAAEFGPDNTVIDYFIACKNGDIETIKQLITGPFYEKRKVLLNSNTEYSDFLARRYKGVEINVVSVSMKEINRLSEVVVEQKYPDGSHLKTTFTVTKEDDKMWKIYRQEF